MSSINNYSKYTGKQVPGNRRKNSTQRAYIYGSNKYYAIDAEQSISMAEVVLNLYSEVVSFKI